MSVDGIEYRLVPIMKGHTTLSYRVLINGEPAPVDRLIVAKHLGASADKKYAILAPGLPRLEYDTKLELFEGLARVLHG